MDSLKFRPFLSIVENSFWHKLRELKIDVDKLDEKEKPIWGWYLQPGLASISVNSSSFNKVVERSLYTNVFTSLEYLCMNDNERFNPLLPVKGIHLNVNTLEAFKNHDKAKLLEACGKSIIDDIIATKALKNPTLLLKFMILSFADLKSYDFYYWFAFPAFYLVKPVIRKNHIILKNVFSEVQLLNLLRSHADLPEEQQSMFGILAKGDSVKCISFEEFIPLLNCNSIEKNEEKIFLCFLDPSTDENYPGWPLRNLLAAVSYYKNFDQLNLDVICLRVGPNFRSSPVLNITLNATAEIFNDKWVGWEKNSKGNFGPKLASLKDSMDPGRLVESSSQLNLKLMKWRIVPELNLDSIASQKCLVIGAGTLGCAIARNLLSWGVQHIDFIDSGIVSYSNPVRQCLYSIDDCSKMKALAAAASLKTILPTVKSEGIVLEIPMPGHQAACLESAKKLHDIIGNYDAIFLVTDTRESRWLPTLIATALNKFTITAALGFESYLVIRHGLWSSKEGTKLGCYFCNDITAPGNSKLDRTLDQQCTVTRPGVSNIAASIATELMVSTLQHPERGAAKSSEESILGNLSHSVRGYLSDFSQITPSTESFSKCIACSQTVINKYTEEKECFLTKVFQSSSYLEEITGLVDLHKETFDIWDLSDESEEAT